MTPGDAVCRLPNFKVLGTASGRWSLLSPVAPVESQRHEFGELARHRARRWKPQKSLWHGMLLSKLKRLPVSLARRGRGRESLGQVPRETPKIVLPQPSSGADQAHLHGLSQSLEPLQPAEPGRASLYDWQILSLRDSLLWIQLRPVSCNPFCRR